MWHFPSPKNNKGVTWFNKAINNHHHHPPISTKVSPSHTPLSVSDSLFSFLRIWISESSSPSSYLPTPCPTNTPPAHLRSDGISNPSLVDPTAEPTYELRTHEPTATKEPATTSQVPTYYDRPHSHRYIHWSENLIANINTIHIVAVIRIYFKSQKLHLAHITSNTIKQWMNMFAPKMTTQHMGIKWTRFVL